MSQVKLTADSGGGTTSLKAPSSTTSNADVVLKLPVADGSANQVLKTDGSGQLSFTSNAGTTINNNADNRVITGSGTASTLEGEANLTYDGNALSIISSANQADGLIIHNTNNSQAHADAAVMISGGDNASAFLRLENNSQKFEIIKDANHNLVIEDDGTERLRIHSSGIVTVGNDPSGAATYGGQMVIATTSGGVLTCADTGSGERLRLEGGSGLGRIGTDSNHDLTFITNGTSNERLRIASDGRITQKGGDLIIDNTNNGYGGLRIVDDSGGEYTVNYIAGRNSGATAHVFKINGRTQNQSPWANSGSDSECARISQQGLAFNGDTAAANCLDDYEEGTWTPAVDTTYVSGTPTYHGQTGTYTKIGNRVFINGNCHINSISFSNNSQIFKITGLPFNGATSSGGAAGTTGSTVFQQLEWVGASNSSYGTNNDVVISPAVNGSNKIVFKICSQDKYYVSELKNEGVDGNQALFRFSFFYQTA